MVNDDGHVVVDTAGSSSEAAGALYDRHGLLMSVDDGTYIVANGRRTVNDWGTRPSDGGVFNRRRRHHNHLVDRRLLLFGIVEGLKIDVGERQQERVVEARHCTDGR